MGRQSKKIILEEKTTEQRVAMKRGYLLRKFGGEIFQKRPAKSDLMQPMSNDLTTIKNESLDKKAEQSSFLMFCDLLKKSQNQLINSLKPVELSSPGRTIQGIRESLICKFKENNKDLIKCDVNLPDLQDTHLPANIKISPVKKIKKHIEPQKTKASPIDITSHHKKEIPQKTLQNPPSLLLDYEQQEIPKKHRFMDRIIKPCTIQYDENEVFQIDSPGYKAFLEEHDFTNSMLSFLNDLSPNPMIY